MTRPFDKWLFIGLGLLIAVLLVDEGIAYRNSRQLHDDGYSVAHTHETLYALDNLVSTLKDAETGQRGFLITGEEQYLKPYEDALSAVDGKIANLKRLTADNEREQARMPLLQELVRAKLDELSRTIVLRKGSGFDAAQKEVLTHLGKSKMDALRAVVSEMKEEERGLLRKRQDTNDRAYRTAIVSGVFGAALGLMAIVACVWIVRRHLNDRLAAAAILHEQREWFRTTLSSIGDAVIATDTEGRVTFQNSVAEALTGWKTSEAEGEPLDTVFRIINQESRKTVENPAARAMREGRVVGLANHTLLISKTGVECPIDDSAAPIRDQNGKIAGVVLVFRDITSRRREDDARRKHMEQMSEAGERLRVQAEALKDADRSKDEFLATLAHELRNPLAPIRNAVQILKLKDSPDSEAQWSKEVIDRQVRVMARLLDDLLDVSRITRRKLELRQERISLASVIDNAVETSGPLIAAAGHSLNLALSPEPIYVDGDPIRLAQVLSNLLNNAAKYTDRGGTIWLSTRQEGGEAVLSVQDNGIGIAADMLPHIFDMFTQATPALEQSQTGLGIGLSLVRGLVELHGGTIEPHSDGPGKGSEFVVRLPAMAAAPIAEPKPTGGAKPLVSIPPKSRVLVAEDNTDAAESLVRLLRLEGHDVQAVYDGRQAVERADNFRPDVALLDIGLPHLSGYDVARQLRKQPWGKQMTLVALTGWGQEEDKRLAKEAGFDRHFVKPIDLAVLFALLAEVRKRSGE